MRLFMVPGWGTAAAAKAPTRSTGRRARAVGGAGQGAGTDRRVARRPTAQVDRTRPLCPYPQVATYKGTGSTDDAANFTCSKP